MAVAVLDLERGPRIASDRHGSRSSGDPNPLLDPLGGCFTERKKRGKLGWMNFFGNRIRVIMRDLVMNFPMS